MPYTIKEVKSNPPERRHCLVKQDGTIKQCHRSRSLAHKARKAIMMQESGGIHTRRKTR